MSQSTPATPKRRRSSNHVPMTTPVPSREPQLFPRQSTPRVSSGVLSPIHETSVTATSMNTTVGASSENSLEPPQKRGPGCNESADSQEYCQFSWVHCFVPLFDSMVAEPSDPSCPYRFCEFGKNGHYVAGRQLSKSFRYLDGNNLEQVRKAYFQHLLTTCTDCKVPENHPPHVQRQSLFSLMARGNGIVINVEEVFLDLCYASQDDRDLTRLNAEGCLDQQDHRVGITKFGWYLQQVMKGKLGSNSRIMF